jgi:hypothetical protein
MELIDMPLLLGAGGEEVQMKLGGSSGTPLWWAARRVCDRTSASDRTPPTSPKNAGSSSSSTSVGATSGSSSSATSVGASSASSSSSALEVATRLVQQGADVDAVGRDADGNVGTPLWWAAQVGADTRLR